MAFFSPNGSIVYTWSMSNALILAVDSALRTLWAQPRASRPNPAASVAALELNHAEQRQAGALMRWPRGGVDGGHDPRGDGAALGF